LQGGLATEQKRDLLQLALTDRPLDAVVGQDEALEIGKVLGEGQPIAAGATESPAGIAVAVLLAVPLPPIEIEDVEEVGAGLGELDGTGAVGQLAQARGVGREIGRASCREREWSAVVAESYAE